MVRTALTIMGVATFIIVGTPSASAQFGFVGYGSTGPGDVLRGEGVFMAGAGSYLFNEARATSINVNTAIRLNEYLYAIAKHENEENAKHRAARIGNHRRHYQEILDRIRNSPEEKDVLRGDALNSLRQDLMSPDNESSVRLAKVALPLPGDTIRRIPFAFSQAGATFSMERLVVTEAKWPLGFRGSEFASERRNYKQAVDNALDQLSDGKGKLSRPAVAAVARAVQDLGDKLDAVFPPNRREKIYIEARLFRERLQKMADLFKDFKIEQIMCEIDTYDGTTVYDLLQFMQRNALTFGLPDEIGEEKSLYPQIFAALKAQRDGAGIPADGAVK